jgi:hypothetical protein
VRRPSGPSKKVRTAAGRQISSASFANLQGDTDAHSGLGDFGDRDGLNRAGGRPDVRSGLSGLPACLHPGGQLLRMPLYVAASVQRVGIGPRGTVRHQSIFRERERARGLSAASPRLLKLILEHGYQPAPANYCPREKAARHEARRPECDNKNWGTAAFRAPPGLPQPWPSPLRRPFFLSSEAALNVAARDRSPAAPAQRPTLCRERIVFWRSSTTAPASVWPP